MSIDGDIEITSDTGYAEVRMHKMISSLQNGIKILLEGVLNRKVELEYDKDSEEYKWKIL